MLPYLVTFFIAILSTYNAQRCRTMNVQFYVYSCLAVIPLVLLAAFRDPSIGTDTITYIGLYEDAMNRTSLWDYVILHPSFELGYLVYNYLLAKYCITPISYFIITYGIMISLVYASAMKLKKFIKPHLFLFIYLFLFYSDTLNMMRQSFAMSIVLYATANLILERKYQYVIWTAIACLFHTSATLSLMIGGVYWVVRKYPIKKHKLLYVCMCALAFFIAGNMNRIVSLGILPIFEAKFDGYLSDGAVGGLSLSHIVLYACTLLFLSISGFKDSDPVSDLMVLLAVLTLILFMSPGMNAILYRLVLYFNIAMCIAVPYAHHNCFVHSKKISLWPLMSLYVGFYFFSIVINGTHEVIPYVSDILGI